MVSMLKFLCLHIQADFELFYGVLLDYCLNCGQCWSTRRVPCFEFNLCEMVGLLEIGSNF